MGQPQLCCSAAFLGKMVTMNMTMNNTTIWATVVAIGKNREKAEKLQAELDTIRNERLRDGIKAIYTRDGIRDISVEEMEALAQ